MNLYKIINDESKLLEFIEWLPDLESNEKYLLSLFSRKKYDQDTVRSNDKTQLKRFTCTKENMYRKIKQLELPVGYYTLKGREVTQKSLVLYINPNPRCMIKATKMMGKKCWDLVDSNNFNLERESLSCIQKSKSRSCFVDFDIDTDEGLNFSELKKIIPDWRGITPYNILRTRGGYHLLVKPSLATRAIKSFNSETLGDGLSLNWHGKIRELYDVDSTGDQFIPVPGTTQGGHVPYFMYF